MDANNELVSKYTNAPFELKTKVYAIAHFHNKLTNMDRGITCEEQCEFLGDYWKLNAVKTVEDVSIETYMQDFLYDICDNLVKENVDVLNVDHLNADEVGKKVKEWVDFCIEHYFYILSFYNDCKVSTFVEIYG